MIERIRKQGYTIARAAEAAGVFVRTAYKWLPRYRSGERRRSTTPAWTGKG